MIRTWNYKCDDCDKLYLDYPYEGERPKSIKCECGGKATWTFTDLRAQIHTTNSAMYGKWEPGLGAYVESYEHKKKLMKELDVIEAHDPVGGSRCHQPSEDELKPRELDESNASSWLDDGDLAKAEQDALDRASRGEFDITM